MSRKMISVYAKKITKVTPANLLCVWLWLEVHNRVTFLANSDLCCGTWFTKDKF